MACCNVKEVWIEAAQRFAKLSSRALLVFFAPLCLILGPELLEFSLQRQQKVNSKPILETLKPEIRLSNLHNPHRTKHSA